MVNPLAPAYDFFLNFWASMPAPVQHLIYLVIGLYAISVIVNLIMH